MLDLIIFIVSDGPHATPDILTKTVSSIESTIGLVEYKYYLVLSAQQEKVILKMIKTGTLNKEKILKIKKSIGSWAHEYNQFFDSCKKLTKYILYSHDDLIIRTKDFFNTTMRLIAGKEKEIGWITFTGDFYYRILGRPWAVSARPGFHTDKDKWPYLFECHRFNDSHRGKSKENLHLLDMPKSGKLVKIHAPYMHFNIVSVESMEIIGPCEEWTLYPHLNDEDWGLEALKKNLWNIWIPDVYYTHPINFHKRKGGNRWTEEAHAGFIKKWGFDEGTNNPTAVQIEEIKAEHKNNLIPWSLNYNTYDWQYL